MASRLDVPYTTARTAKYDPQDTNIYIVDIDWKLSARSIEKGKQPNHIYTQDLVEFVNFATS